MAVSRIGHGHGHVVFLRIVYDSVFVADGLGHRIGERPGVIVFDLAEFERSLFVNSLAFDLSAVIGKNKREYGCRRLVFGPSFKNFVSAEFDLNGFCFVAVFERSRLCFAAYDRAGVAGLGRGEADRRIVILGHGVFDVYGQLLGGGFFAAFEFEFGNAVFERHVAVSPVDGIIGKTNREMEFLFGVDSVLYSLDDFEIAGVLFVCDS